MENLSSYRAILASSVVFQRLGPAELDLVLTASQLIDAEPGQLLLSEGTMRKRPLYHP